MADYAEGAGSPPPELIFAWRLEKWGAEALGVCPLSLALLKVTETVLRTYEIFKLRKETGAVEFTEKHKGWAAYAAEVDEWR